MDSKKDNKQTSNGNGEKAEDKSEGLENAARDFGLEDVEATATDPRVSNFKHSYENELKSKSTVAMHPNVARKYGLEDHEVHHHNPHASGILHPTVTGKGASNSKILANNVDSEPVSSKTNGGNDAQVMAEEKIVPVVNESKVAEDQPVIGKKLGVETVGLNTEITIDPTKVYATKTTNTLGPLYSEDEESILETENAIQKYQVVEPPKPKPPPPPSNEGFDLDACFTFAVQLVKRAGTFVQSSANQPITYTLKDHEKDLNTTIDNAVEEMIIKDITERYPTHSIIAEEEISRSETGKVTLTDNPTWIVDPIDGTMNMVHQFPYYCISIALLIKKETVFGIVYNPSMRDLYTARKGKGANLNDVPIRNSGQERLKQAMVLQEYSFGMNESRMITCIENIKRLSKRTHALRSIGSSAMGLAMVAAGMVDAFYFFGLHIWDMAAGNLLVEEAGGIVLDPAGGKLDLMSRRVLAAATQALATELSMEIQQNYPKPRDDETKKVISVNNPVSRDFSAQTEFSDSSISLSSDNSKPNVHVTR